MVCSMVKTALYDTVTTEIKGLFFIYIFYITLHELPIAMQSAGVVFTTILLPSIILQAPMEHLFI